MSTLIQFRVSGDDEQDLLDAARQAGMRPADFVRQSAKQVANRPDTVLQRIEQRLEAIEAKLAAPQATQPAGLASVIKGIEVEDLVIEIRREVRDGFSAILVLLDGEPLPDIKNSRAPPDSGR